MRLNLGLQKLIQGAKDVAAMKIVLAEEQKKLEVATTETMKMLEGLEVSSAEARKEGEQASAGFLRKVVFIRFEELIRVRGLGLWCNNLVRWCNGWRTLRRYRSNLVQFCSLVQR